MAATKSQELVYRDAFRSLYHHEFQSWFERIARALHEGGDFQSIRNTQGDGGIDGYVISSQHVFQVYAPARMIDLRDSETAQKMRENFSQALSLLKGQLRAWTFVHNHPEGDLGKLGIAALNQIKETYPNIHITVHGINSLWEEIRTLSDIALAELFGPATPPSGHTSTEFPSRKVIALPYPPLGRLFKGREAFLALLHRRLSQSTGRVAISTGALHGLGGVGKTRAAIEYAWAHLPEFRAVLFLSAEDIDSLRRNFANLGRPLILNLAEYRDQDEEVRIAAVAHWLNTNPDWLLIFDGADRPSVITEISTLLGSLSGGRVIVTSRISSFSAHIQSIELGILSENEAVSFVIERTESYREELAGEIEATRELVSKLGCLALALEQAGAYIAKHKIGIGRYVELWSSNWDSVAHWSDEAITNYPRAVAVTWRTSLDEVGNDGRWLLDRLSWFGTEPIPHTILDPSVVGMTADCINAALVDLASYSLVRLSNGGAVTTIHALVQEVSRRELLRANRSPESLEDSINWITDQFKCEPSDPMNWRNLEPLAGHASTICAHAEALKINAIVLQSQLGHFLYSKGRFLEAEKFCRIAVEGSERGLPESKDILKVALSNLAAVLEATERFDEAEALYERSLLLIERELDGTDPILARCLGNFGLLLQHTGRRSEAEAYFRRALAVDMSNKNKVSDHGVAGNMINLAEALSEKGVLLEVESLFRRAIKENEDRFGPRHPHVAMALSKLANFLRSQGKLIDAESLFGRALNIYDEGFGRDEARYAEILNDYGLLLNAQNRPAEAESAHRQSLSIDEANYGPAGFGVGTSLNNIALTLGDARNAEAESLFRRALQIFEAKRGKAHHSFVSAQLNLAALLSDTERLEEAEELARGALSVLRQMAEPQAMAVGNALSKLGSILQKAGKYSEAEGAYRHGFDEIKKVVGEKHFEVLEVLHGWAGVLDDLGRSSEAAPLFRKALSIAKRSYGPSHPSTGAVFLGMTSVLRHQGRLVEAERVGHRAVAIAEQHFGGSHESTAVALVALGAVFEAGQRDVEAQRLYARASEIFSRTEMD
jgi:tetratricopeptide (TPR) repeat protein